MTQLQVYHDFKHYNVPAMVGEGIQDRMEKLWTSDKGVDFFTTFADSLDTYLTTTNGINGKTLAESPITNTRSAALMVVNGNPSEDVASTGHQQRNGNGNGNRGRGNNRGRGGRGRGGRGRGNPGGRNNNPPANINTMDSKPNDQNPPNPAPQGQRPWRQQQQEESD